MCTLTVVTGSDTYRIAMNRDEKTARGAGMPPEMHEFDATRAIYPNDGDGGTWIAANDCGVALALLNWNDIAAPGKAVKTRSRGRVIPALIDSRSLWDCTRYLALLTSPECCRFGWLASFLPKERFGNGVGTRPNSRSRFMNGSPVTGFPRASLTIRPRACVGLHAVTLSMNRMSALCPGCEDFTRRTGAVQGHLVCASTGRTRRR
jgi:Transport and Golgi organisation 2